ncbi:MAG: hypothetical protein Q9187_004776 [Circinaria calcarea]
MTHAHPSPDKPDLPASHSVQPSWPSNSTAVIGPPSTAGTPISPLQHDRVSQQNRRLQLRNAGFRGPILPARRMTSYSSGTTSISDFLGRSANDENSPRTAEKRMLYGEDLPPSPVSILQEISNTARRKRNSPRPSLSGILEDSTATEGISRAMVDSGLDDPSCNFSPQPIAGTPFKMHKLREASLNTKTTPPPLYTPLARPIKSRRKARVASRSTGSEATKYIEHLESELASLHTKLDELTSPTATRAQSAKFRALTRQTRELRQEVVEWETKFDERVTDEVFHRTAIEAELKIRIRRLEDEVELKDIKMRELEWELDSALVKVKDTDSLKSTNLNLERRVDVLTELLAQSPTRLDFQSALSSPGITGNSGSTQKTPRPKSMILPRIPFSPVNGRRSSAPSSEAAFWFARNMASTSSIPESPEEETLSPLEDAGKELGQTSIITDHTISPAHGSNASASTRPSLSSRPTSLTSNSSMGASLGLLLPANQNDESKSMSRQRRMRRFPSGTHALKPLVLPTATVVPSLPASAPIYGTNLSPIRGISNTSLDPTTAFISKVESSSPFITPTQPVRRRSTTWAQKNAFDALEGKPTWTPATDGTVISRRELEATPSQVTGARGDRDEEPKTAKNSEKQRRSLQFELDHIKESLATASETPSPPHIADQLDRIAPVSMHRPKLHLDITTPDKSPNSLFLHNSPNPHRSLGEFAVTPNQLTPSLSRRLSPRTSNATSTLITTNTNGALTKVAELISSVREDPLVLARRILRNGWISGSSKIGGLGWWLLGLAFGSKRWKRNVAADRQTEEEEAMRRLDWQQFSAEAGMVGRAGDYHQASFGISDRSRQQGQRQAWHESDGSPQPSKAVLSIASDSRGDGYGTFPSRCTDCIEPPSRRSFRLWFRFSLAVVLAIGLAIKDGPGVLMVEGPAQTPPPYELEYHTRSESYVPSDSDDNSGASATRR